jgi:hypothetical protein
MSGTRTQLPFERLGGRDGSHAVRLIGAEPIAGTVPRERGRPLTAPLSCTLLCTLAPFFAVVGAGPLQANQLLLCNNYGNRKANIPVTGVHLSPPGTKYQSTIYSSARRTAAIASG